MRKLKAMILFAAVVSVSILASCGGGEDDTEPSQQEVLTDALTSKTWSVDATATNVSNVSGSPDATTFTVTFSDAGNGTINYTLGGDLSSYISGGSFSIAEAGAVSNFTVNAASAELAASVSSLTVTETQVRIVVEVSEASSRVGGIGTYTIVFTAA